MEYTPKRILIVDDEESFAGAVAFALSKNHGYEATAVYSGRDAIEKLQSDEVDVVLLDHKMPEMTGLNVLQWMHEQKMDTPVIMLTAAGSENIAVEAMKLGALDYHRKDHVDVDHLPVLINGVYERYLFRKDRDKYEEEKRRDEIRNEYFEMFRSSVELITSILNNTIPVVEMHMQNQFYYIQQFVGEEHKQKLEFAIKEIQMDFRIISSSMKALVNLINAMYDKKGIDSQLPRLRDQLKKTLAEIANVSSKS